MIELTEFSIRYPDKEIWYPDLKIEKGEAVGIFGRSGCGKTSLLNALCEAKTPGELKYRSAFLMGKELCAWGVDRWKRMSYVPQFAQNALNPKLTVGEHFSLVQASNGMQKNTEPVLQLFEKLGLDPEFLKRHPYMLSGGQKQRIILALAVIKRPELLLLDEPSSALDLITLKQIVEFLQEIRKSMTIVMVAHQHELLEKVTDRIVEL